MWKRVVALTLLIILAGLAAYVILPGNSIHAPEVVATDQAAPEQPKPLQDNAAPEKPETTKPDNTQPTSETPPEPEAALDTITFKGRLLWTPPCPHAAYTDLQQLGATVSLLSRTAEGGIRVAESLPVKADGSFALEYPLSAEPEERAGQLRLLKPGQGFELGVTIRPSRNWPGRGAEFELVPHIADRMVDFGDVEVSLEQCVADYDWVVTGRLLGPGGETLGDQSQFDLLCFRGSWPMPVYVETDREGWFVTTYSESSSFGRYDRQLSPITVAKWWLDIGDTSYIHEDIWRFEDALIGMPAPQIDADRQVIDFGEVRLDVSILEVSIAMSDAASRALDAAGPGHVFWCSVSLVNDDADYTFKLPQSGAAALCVLPGRYSVKSEFVMATVKEFEADNPPIIFPPDDDMKSFLGTTRDWSVQRSAVEVPAGVVVKLNLTIEPVRELLVQIETPLGPAKTAELELGWHHPEDPDDLYEDTWEYCPLPARVRINPDDRAELLVRVDDCEPTKVEIPPTGSELVVHLSAVRRKYPVTVKFSGTEPPDFKAVRVYAKSGLETLSEYGHPGKGTPLELQLSEGHWEFFVPPFDSMRSRFPRYRVATLDVTADGVNEVQLPPLSWPVAPKKAYAGDNPVTGAATALFSAGTSNTEFDEPGYVGICDGEVLHKPDSKGELHLPERIRVNVPQSLVDAVGASGLRISCSYAGGYCASGGDGLTHSLWAPPGACTVSLEWRDNERWYFEEWSANVVPGQLTELAAAAAWGTVRVNKLPRSATEDRYRERSSSPDWLLFRLGDRKVKVATFGSWPWGDPIQCPLIAGEYEFRLAFGPGAAEPIRFTVAEGRETELQLPYPESVPCNGSVLLPLPEGFSGSAEADIEWNPTMPGHCASGDYYVFSTRTRVVAGKLLIHGLLIGESMELTVELTCSDATGSKTWTATTAAFTLADSKQRDVAVSWTLKPDE